MSKQFLAAAASLDWLKAISGDATLFFPSEVKDRVHWQRLDPAALSGPDSLVPALERIRASEPVKSFFFSPREKVAEMPGRMEPAAPGKRILFGAKACDIAALRVHRKLYLEQDFKDDFYRARRENTLIIVADCPVPEETCFCNLVSGRPYATDDDRDEADVAMSVVEGGWLLEPLSDAGEKLVGLARTTSATESQLARREQNRAAAGKRLDEINSKQFGPDLPARIWKRNQDDAFWSWHAEDCVECYGCLMACPTCYCFLLYDKRKQPPMIGPPTGDLRQYADERRLYPGEDADGRRNDMPPGESDVSPVSGPLSPVSSMERTKVWDACYIAAYARVGGGANPRAEFVKRFYNRFYCKFSHWPQYFAPGDHRPQVTGGGWQPACSGCGRCYNVCMGKIDIRKVLAEV